MAKTPVVKVLKLNSFATVPVYASKGAAGADLSACLDKPAEINPGERLLVPTGLSIEIPNGFEGQVRPRSGLALKKGITVLNSPGTIDEDYRGELKVILYNAGSETVTVQHGDRIAQLIIAPVVRSCFHETDELSETIRATEGFGSTGK